MIPALRNRFSKYIKIFLPGFFLTVFIALQLYLISKTFVIDKSGNIRTAIAGYGDIPFHLTQITKFAFQNPINLGEPIYYGQKLDYPFLINLISGFMLRETGNFSLSVLFPVFILAAINIVLVFWIYRKFLNSAILACLSVLLFYLGSGFGGLVYIQKAIVSKFNFIQFISYLTQNNITTVVKYDAKYPDQNIDIGAPLSLIFLHQRAFFMGFFGFLLFLLLIIMINKKTGRKYMPAVAGIIFGLLPLAHMHSFIVAAITIASFILVSLVRKNFDYFKKLVFIGVVGGAIAFPQVIYLTYANSSLLQSASFIMLRLGWMVPPTFGSITYPNGTLPTIFSLSFIEFLLLNFGIILPLYLISFIRIFFRKNILHNANFLMIFSFALSGLLIFLSAQLVRFQPWDFDDNKLFIYFQFFAIPLIVFIINDLYLKRRIVGISIATIFIALSLFSGVIDIIPRIAAASDTLPIIFSLDSQRMANYIRRNIPQENLILTGTDHRNPVVSLAGRPVLVGFPGWLWTKGINYYQRENQVKQFYASPSKNSPLISEFKIKYILLDNQAIFDLKASKEIFDREFTIIYQTGEYTLYKI